MDRRDKLAQELTHYNYQPPPEYDAVRDYLARVMSGQVAKEGLNRYQGLLGGVYRGDQQAFQGLLGDMIPGPDLPMGGLLGKIIDIKTPRMTYTSSPSMPLGYNPTQREWRELYKTAGEDQLRILLNKNSGDVYAWPPFDALHADIIERMKLNNADWERGFIDKANALR